MKEFKKDVRTNRYIYEATGSYEPQMLYNDIAWAYYDGDLDRDNHPVLYDFLEDFIRENFGTLCIEDMPHPNDR